MGIQEPISPVNLSKKRGSRDSNNNDLINKIQDHEMHGTMQASEEDN